MLAARKTISAQAAELRRVYAAIIINYAFRRRGASRIAVLGAEDNFALFHAPSRPDNSSLARAMTRLPSPVLPFSISFPISPEKSNIVASLHAPPTIGRHRAVNDVMALEKEAILFTQVI